jgi:hypothetical protein
MTLYHARWRVRNNNELQKLIKENIVKYLQGQRMKWWRRLNRMEDIKLVKKVTVWKPIEVRTKGRPKNRWRDEVINDLKKPKLRIWIQIVKDRKT